MLHAITPSSSVLSLPSTSKNDATEIDDHAILDVEGDISSRPRNISSTLQKLYLWEKKLFEEVKVLFLSIESLFFLFFSVFHHLQTLIESFNWADVSH